MIVSTLTIDFNGCPELPNAEKELYELLVNTHCAKWLEVAINYFYDLDPVLMVGRGGAYQGAYQGAHFSVSSMGDDTDDDYG